MTRLQQQKGFTLVELAIVMVIIGLLIGGILKGQELMQNARVTATLSQVKALLAAATAFSDRYAFFPGDGNGTNVIPGCTGTVCTTSQPRNGIIGSPTWDLTAVQAASGGLVAAPVGTENEPTLFWYYLFATNFLSGGDSAAPLVGSAVAGKSHLIGKFGNSYVIGHSDGGAGAGNGNRGASTEQVTIIGTVLSVVQSLTTFDAAGTSGSMPLKPNIAASLDRKDDDGRPGTGHIQAWGFTNCTAGGAQAFDANTTYNEDNPAKDCGLYWGDILG